MVLYTVKIICTDISFAKLPVRTVS